MDLKSAMMGSLECLKIAVPAVYQNKKNTGNKMENFGIQTNIPLTQHPKMSESYILHSDYCRRGCDLYNS